jgi:predicted GIY-YIG superfamily endonuclease
LIFGLRPWPAGSTSWATPESRLYIGVTADVAVRLQQHNSGENKWTAKFRPWELHWVSNEFSLGEALPPVPRFA